MKVLVMSDTHGAYGFWQKLEEYKFWGAELILHAGDVTYHGPRNDLPGSHAPKKLIPAINNSPIPLIIAEGNCDAYVDQMSLEWPITTNAFAFINGKRVMVNHGHLLDDDEKKRLAQKYKLDILITGHTHIPVLKKEDGVVYINPGSTSISKRPDKIPTCVLLEDNVATLFNLDDGTVLESLNF